MGCTKKLQSPCSDLLEYPSKISTSLHSTKNKIIFRLCDVSISFSLKIPCSSLAGVEGRYQSTLKKVEVKLVPRNVCQQQLRKTRLGGVFKLHDSFICASGGPNQDACKVSHRSSLSSTPDQVRLSGLPGSEWLAIRSRQFKWIATHTFRYRNTPIIIF
jgi:hypothetical protein